MICPACNNEFPLRHVRLIENMPVTYEPAQIPDPDSLDYAGDNVLYFVGSSYVHHYEGGVTLGLECPRCFNEIPIPDGMGHIWI